MKRDEQIGFGILIVVIIALLFNGSCVMPGENGNGETGENETYELGCPEVDPQDIPYEDYPFYELEPEYDLVGACAEGICAYQDEVCSPYLDHDWMFQECACFYPGALCSVYTSQEACEAHYCKGTIGIEEGYVKQCMWDIDLCQCPFDVVD